jgi:hypothetical protein
MTPLYAKIGIIAATASSMIYLAREAILYMRLACRRPLESAHRADAATESIRRRMSSEAAFFGEGYHAGMLEGYRLGLAGLPRTPTNRECGMTTPADYYARDFEGKEYRRADQF